MLGKLLELLNQLHTVAYINKNNHYVLDEIEEHDGVAGAAARGDFGVSEPNQELLEANCTDLEPDIEADVSSRNCSNVPWSASTQGEPSNFSVRNQKGFSPDCLEDGDFLLPNEIDS